MKPCVICGKEIETRLPRSNFGSYGGLEGENPGHICDGCFEELMEKHFRKANYADNER